MGFFRRNDEDDAYLEDAGVPNTFKTWFWIRLAVCIYIIYLGGNLVYQWYTLGIGWGYAAGGIALALVAIVIAAIDIRRYVKLLKYIKEKKISENESNDNNATNTTVNNTDDIDKTNQAGGSLDEAGEGKKVKGIRQMSHWSSDPGEDDRDDEDEELKETGAMDAEGRNQE